MEESRKNDFAGKLIELSMEYSNQEAEATERKDFDRLMELAKLKEHINALLEDLDK